VRKCDSIGIVALCCWPCAEHLRPRLAPRSLGPHVTDRACDVRARLVCWPRLNERGSSSAPTPDCGAHARRANASDDHEPSRIPSACANSWAAAPAAERRHARSGCPKAPFVAPSSLLPPCASLSSGPPPFALLSHPTQVMLSTSPPLVCTVPSPHAPSPQPSPLVPRGLPPYRASRATLAREAPPSCKCLITLSSHTSLISSPDDRPPRGMPEWGIFDSPARISSPRCYESSFSKRGVRPVSTLLYFALD